MDKRMSYIKENLVYEMEYSKYLEKKGFKEKKIKEQLIRLRKYLDEFCVIHMGKSMKEMNHLKCIEEFFYFLDKEGTPSFELIRYSSSIGRFYLYMYELGDISEEEYIALKKEIETSRDFTVSRADAKNK